MNLMNHIEVLVKITLIPKASPFIRNYNRTRRIVLAYYYNLRFRRFVAHTKKETFLVSRQTSPKTHWFGNILHLFNLRLKKEIKINNRIIIINKEIKINKLAPYFGKILFRKFNFRVKPIIQWLKQFWASLLEIVFFIPECVYNYFFNGSN